MSREDAERRVAEVFAAGSREDLVHAYAGWAGRYDEDTLSLDLRGPEIVAAMAARHLEDRTSPILDAGAGTGRIGALLAILGYGHLVALDLSAAMLARARERGVYRELHEGALGDPLPFADGTFAAVVAAGVLTAGHAPPDSLDELLRVTRPGGLLAFTLSTTAYGRGGFRDRLDALEADGRWRLVEATAPFVGMPASTAYREHTARVLVFEAGRGGMAGDPEPDLVVESDPDPGHARFLEDRLYEYNLRATGIADGELLAISLRGPDGEVVGGAYGWTWGGTCHVRHLFVPAGMRNQGHGSRMMRAIERAAAARGCGQVVLETHDFQAPAFYSKLGFVVVGAVADYPRGHRQLTMLKSLVKP